MKASMDFTEGSVPKQMIIFAVPLFFSNMLQAVYNMVDMVVVGQVIGRNGISAVSIGGDILSFLTFLAMGFSNAGQVIIAQHIGAGKKERIGPIIGNLFSFLLMSAAAMTVICFLFRKQMLLAMNTPAEAWDYALSYVTTCIVGLIFIYGYNAISAILRGLGDSRHPFIFVAVAAVINLVLDILFIAVFHMAAFGAALATVIGQGVSFVWGLIFIIVRRRELGISIDRGCFRFDDSIIKTLVGLGMPMAIKSGAVIFSKLFVDAWINSYGVVASSASGIESKLNIISNLFTNAINMGASSMIGQNIGAEKYDRVPKIMKTAFGINMCIGLLLSALLAVFPLQVFGIFTADADVIKACMLMIPLMALIFIGGALRSPNNGLIDGSGNYYLNFVVALLDGIVNRIGFALLFGVAMGMGWLGFLYGDAVAGFTPFLVGGIYFISGKWRTRKYIIH